MNQSGRLHLRILYADHAASLFSSSLQSAPLVVPSASAQARRTSPAPIPAQAPPVKAAPRVPDLSHLAVPVRPVGRRARPQIGPAPTSVHEVSPLAAARRVHGRRAGGLPSCCCREEGRLPGRMGALAAAGRSSLLIPCSSAEQRLRCAPSGLPRGAAAAGRRDQTRGRGRWSSPGAHETRQAPAIPPVRRPASPSPAPASGRPRAPGAACTRRTAASAPRSTVI
jgi:hypothetical protein